MEKKKGVIKGCHTETYKMIAEQVKPKESIKAKKIRKMYAPVINAFIKIYASHPKASNYPFEIIFDSFFTHIDYALKDGTPLSTYQVEFINYIKGFDCFSWVTYSKKQPWVWWNPLETCFEEFIKKHPDYIIDYFPSNQYPTRTQIEFWVKHCAKHCKTDDCKIGK